ncbi:MAG: hypothetical protein EAS48_07530 [Chryseobacterium sp.]|nr:MAG: hypothetical protein EAS48_07530 [Chryseobacterium sp.]
MAFYQLSRSQKIPASVTEVWEFISAPANLSRITPPDMGFLTTSDNSSEKMYPGMIITYKVSPLFGIKLNWMTEITHVVENEYFVDEQRISPYALWHHQHRLKEIEGGVLMTDLVTYRPPFGIIGALANLLVIRKKLQQIFDYRTEAVEGIFGSL